MNGRRRMQVASEGKRILPVDLSRSRGTELVLRLRFAEQCSPRARAADDGVQPNFRGGGVGGHLPRRSPDRRQVSDCQLRRSPERREHMAGAAARLAVSFIQPDAD